MHKVQSTAIQYRLVSERERIPKNKILDFLLFLIATICCSLIMESLLAHYFAIGARVCLTTSYLPMIVKRNYPLWFWNMSVHLRCKVLLFIVY